MHVEKDTWVVMITIASLTPKQVTVQLETRLCPPVYSILNDAILFTSN